MNQLSNFLGSAFGAASIALALCLAFLAFVEFGRRVGAQRLRVRGEASRTGVGVVDAAVYSLFSLLIGFTFSGSASRFEGRRQLIINEANAVTTTWERLDLLPAGIRDTLRDDLRGYVDAVLSIHGAAVRSTEGMRSAADLVRHHDELWSRSVAACLLPTGEKARVLLLPALNEMFGAVDNERATRTIHPALVIYVMLAIAALATALFVGYALSATPTRNWIYMLGVSLTIASASFVILELEYPHLGVVRVTRSEQALRDVREMMR